VGGTIIAKTYVDVGSDSYVAGSITSQTSYIDTHLRTTVDGDLTAGGTYIDIHSDNVIGGSMTAASYISMTTNSIVHGSATAGTGTIHINSGSIIYGDAIAGGSVTVYSGATISQCTRSTGSLIYNYSGSTMSGACCGSAGSCTNTCVQFSPKPAACQSLHHLELTTTSSSATANSSVTYTVKACANAACSSLYTWGVTGTLAISGVTPTYVSGAAFSIPSGSSSTTETVQMTAGTATASLSSPSPAPSNSPAVFCGMGVAAASGNSCALTVNNALHHLELTTASATATAGNNVTFTVKACADVACSTLYTSGVTGTLAISGVTPTFPSGASFTIAAASSSTTVTASMTAGTATASLTSPSPTPSNTPTYFCGMGVAAASGNSCALTVNNALHHLEVTATSATAVAGNNVVFTVKACANTACSTLYTLGVTGTLAISGVTPTFPSGASFSIAAASSSTTVTASMTAGTATISVTSPSPTPTNSPTYFCGMGVAAASGNACTITINPALHHLEVTTASNPVTSGTNTTFTVKACVDASCSTLYTLGVTGTLAISGVTPTFPAGAAFSIPAASSSTTVTASMTSGTATISLSTPSPTPTNTPAYFCGMGVAAATGNSCALTVNPPLHHLEITTGSATATAGTNVTFTVRACVDLSCSTLYTYGVNAVLAISGVTPAYPSGAAIVIGSGSSSTTVVANMSPSGTATVSITGITPTPTNSPTYFCGMGVAAASGNACTLTITPALHHLELTTSASSGLTCTPVTYTIKACGDASCATLYTSGVTGNLAVSGAGMTVNYPSGAAFSIGSGASSTTVSAHITTVGTVTSSLSAVAPAATATPSIYCGIGVAASSGGSCNYSTAASGLIFNVLNHYSEVSQSVTVSAVRSSDNATVCTPAFASASKSVLFKCNYSNPASGTKPVRVGGAALNSSNSTSASCDATGRSVSLAFNASGVATTTVQYADVGQMSLTATYTGSGTDAGLSMTGTDTFIAAPYSFGVSGLPTSNTTAGVSFSGTVSARNYSGVVTPNFGQEASPEGADVSFVRAKPTGTAAVNGSFTGSLGAFSSGNATGSGWQWSEVGRGDVAAMLHSGNYLGSGLATTGGSSAGSVSCASEGGTCTLPVGATAMVQYGANGYLATRTGVTGSVACTNAVFGGPINGTAKTCWYVVTSGAAPGTAGTAGPFIPHHFDVATSDSCNGTFTYSGQPFAVTVTARNAANATTVNYDGGVNTSPNYAKVTTLSAPGAATGTLSNASLGASAFVSGVASVLKTDSAPVSFAFTAPPKPITAAAIRATDTDSVSSSGYAEGSVTIRSGRLKFSNAFGSEKSSLSIPVQAQYWSGTSWLINSEDTGACTVVPAAAVALSGYLDHKGASTTVWHTTASASASDKPIGSVSMAFNLGATSADNACQGTHPTTTGANLSWLRSLSSCAATYDRDPSAKVTFGVYSPESSKVIHVRELF
jgi:hypothetical protein